MLLCRISLVMVFPNDRLRSIHRQHWPLDLQLPRARALVSCMSWYVGKYFLLYTVLYNLMSTGMIISWKVESQDLTTQIR